MAESCLYFGDNLDILRHYIKDESVDLIYLDPPFNSNRAYNVIFQDKTGKKAVSQIQAFEDTWWWSDETQAAYDEMLSGSYPDTTKNFQFCKLSRSTNFSKESCRNCRTPAAP